MLQTDPVSENSKKIDQATMNVEERPLNGDFEEFCREFARRLKYYGYRVCGSPIPIYEEVRTHPNIKGELTVADWISKYFSDYIHIKVLETIWRSPDDFLITPKYCFDELLVNWLNYSKDLQNRTLTNAEVSSSALKEILREYNGSEEQGTETTAHDHRNLVEQRNIILAKAYNQANVNKAEITAATLDRISWIKQDPLLLKWNELSFTGALKNRPKTVKTLFAQTAKRHHDKLNG